MQINDFDNWRCRGQEDATGARRKPTDHFLLFITSHGLWLKDAVSGDKVKQSGIRVPVSSSEADDRSASGVLVKFASCLYGERKSVVHVPVSKSRKRAIKAFHSSYLWICKIQHARFCWIFSWNLPVPLVWISNQEEKEREKKKKALSDWSLISKICVWQVFIIITTKMRRWWSNAGSSGNGCWLLCISSNELHVTAGTWE